jgi:hypothetical protein
MSANSQRPQQAFRHVTTDMTEPIDPDLLNAVASIIAILTGLELGEDAAVTEILEQPLRVEEARAYIGALIILCRTLVQQVAAATDVEAVDVLRHLAGAITA